MWLDNNSTTNSSNFSYWNQAFPGYPSWNPSSNCMRMLYWSNKNWVDESCSRTFTFLCETPLSAFTNLPASYCADEPTVVNNAIQHSNFNRSIFSEVPVLCAENFIRSSHGYDAQCLYKNQTHGYWTVPTATCQGYFTNVIAQEILSKML